MVGHRVHFDIAAGLASVVFEQPAGGVEGIADRDIDILMRMVRRGITADDDLTPGNLKIDANPKQVPLLVTRVSAFDDDTARRNPIEEPLEFLCPLAYAAGDRIRRIHMPKGDLKRKLHRLFPFG
jgi:hypothetical protein